MALIKLGQTIRNRREELGLRQTDVAKALGWSSAMLSEVESGTRSTRNASTWVHLAELLQLKPEHLLREAWEAAGSLEVEFPKGASSQASLLSIAARTAESPMPDSNPEANEPDSSIIERVRAGG